MPTVTRTDHGVWPSCYRRESDVIELVVTAYDDMERWLVNCQRWRSP